MNTCIYKIPKTRRHGLTGERIRYLQRCGHRPTPGSAYCQPHRELVCQPETSKREQREQLAVMTKRWCTERGLDTVPRGVVKRRETQAEPPRPVERTLDKPAKLLKIRRTCLVLPDGGKPIITSKRELFQVGELLTCRCGTCVVTGVTRDFQGTRYVKLEVAA